MRSEFVLGAEDDLTQFLMTRKPLLSQIAVEGCCHGELDKIYETIEFIERKEGYKIDLLLICGDFQVMGVACLTRVEP